MTQLETIWRANMYLEKLSHGINPLDDTPIPEGELLKNPRVAKCLAFTAGVLQDVLQNGGITPIEKLKKAPLHIPPELLSQYPFSEQAISISEMVRRINSLINVIRMEPLRHNILSQFLEDQGLLSLVVLPDRKKARRPTDLGLSMGIQTVECGKGAQAYVSVRLDLRAQQYILRHFPEIQRRANQAQTQKQLHATD